MAYTRKDYSGTRAATTLSAGINNSVTSIGIAASTGWPAGTNGPFYAVIDPDTASEEKILVTTRTGTTLNTVTRGVDGSTAASHSSGATIYPCFTAVDADEANYWVAELSGAATATGRLIVSNGTDSLTGLAASTAGKFPVSDGTTFAQVAMSGDATLASSGAVTIANSAVTTAKVNDSAVTNAKLAGMTRGTVKVGNSSGVASDLALGTSGYYLKSDGTDAVWASIGNIAKGQLSGGYAEITSSATLTGATTTDISGLSVTVTIEASRLYKITVYCAGVTTGNILLRESSTTLQALFVPTGTVTGTVGACVWRGTPSAGSHTYKASSTHSGTGSWQAAATSPSFIMVEDIGPA